VNDQTRAPAPPRRPPGPPDVPGPDATGHPAPRVDPRFRRRWAEARRAEGRRRLRALVAVLAAVAVTGGAYGLLHSPLFVVRSVVVTGDVHTPRSAVLAAAGLDGAKGVLMVDAGPPAARRAVDALPWVATATFERRWPWTVVVRVHERRPVAIVEAPGGVDVVDSTGRVLEALRSGEPAPLLPVVTGALPAAPGVRVSPRRGTTEGELSELLQVAAATPPGLARNFLQYSYTAGRGLFALAGSTKTLVLLGDSSQISYKLAVLQDLARNVRLSGYSVADLTVPARPALTPVN
jgi:hypothetical protein